MAEREVRFSLLSFRSSRATSGDVRQPHRSWHVPRLRSAQTGWGLGALLFSLLATPLAAQTRPPADYANVQLRDAAQEAQAKVLMETLRCLVCQGQSIADSDADMAGDMRALVRRRIAAGDSPATVRTWLIARYGDYVSYDPPLSTTTLPLWLAPLALLALGIVIARSSFRRRKK